MRTPIPNIPKSPRIGPPCLRRDQTHAAVDGFDARFFSVSAREARSVDPQHRLLLEVAWEALEDAAIAPQRLARSRTGVYVGISASDYAHLLLSGPITALDGYVGLGTAFNFAPGRLSYLLGLQGPSLALDSACSSSLVARHLACQSLRAGETDLALAGGVSLILSPEVQVILCRARVLAPDGRCKTFDARADGFVRAEGCGVLALKRLAGARRDGDPIRAVLPGSAVNHDGHTMGLTAPSPLAQERLLRAALADAGLQAHDITCIEAHGTGTSLGDPIEVEALQAVYGAPPPGGQRCALASLKTNLGHMKATAGVGGLIKLILALEHEQIPAHLHLKALNPRIRLDDSSLEIPTTPRAWPRAQVPRRAAVSSFGISGTNAHVLVEEAPLLTHTPGKLFESRIHEIRPGVIEGSRTLDVLADIDNREGLLRGSGTVNATVRIAAKATALTVPEQSVVLRPAGKVVYVISDVEGQKRAQAKVVKAGAKRGGRVEILEGLKGGETIALDGAGFLTHNAAVAIKEAAKPGAGPGAPGGDTKEAQSKQRVGADATAKKADPAAQPAAK